jgi:long-subunit acyl-CoA synthetase (AMP-forming)
MQTTPAWPTAVQAATLTEAFRLTAAQHPDVVAVRTIDDSASITWSDLLRRVHGVAGGLASLGVRRGDTVALMVGNRLEFHLADLAVAMLGATPFSIYLTSPPHEVAYLVRDAGARVAIIEQASLPCLREASGLEHVIVVDGRPNNGTLALAEVENADSPIDVAAAAAEIDPDDVLTLIYTSGTTGPPKGVQLSHRNVMAAARAVHEMIELPAGGRLISWLPSAHIAERMAHHYIPAIFAATITCCPDPREVLAYLPRVHPTWFFAVPRIWEKLKAGIEARWASLPDDARHAALVAATERVRLMQRGESVPADLERRVRLADEHIFAALREELGLDRAISTGVGAAPTPVEVVEFFHAIGIELAELWGLSETCGAGTCNRPGAVRIGTAGPPSPGVELRLTPDGEVLVRGDVVMLAYRGSPEQTAEVLDPDGWLRTGDIGTLDADGYLRIVDRKKEIIINASGKNMSPANIEARIKASSPLIGHAVCVGDARPYNVALIVLDPDMRAGRRSDDADVLAELDAAIARANRQLARVEQIKKFTILGEDWAPGGDELTPTMKLKRRPIAAKYAAAIEAMYEPQAGSSSTGMPFRTALPDTGSTS